MMGTIQFGTVTAGSASSNTDLSNMSGNVIQITNTASEFSIGESAIINLNNFMAKDETVIPTSIVPQYGFSPYVTGAFSSIGTASLYALEVVLVSEKPLEIKSFNTLTDLQGFSMTKVDPANVIYGHHKVWTLSGPLSIGSDTLASGNSPFMQLLASDTWGSCTGSANDKWYVYRYFKFANAGVVSTSPETFHVLQVPPMNLLWGAEAVKEEDVVYFSRLRQSWLDRQFTT